MLGIPHSFKFSLYKRSSFNSCGFYETYRMVTSQAFCNCDEAIKHLNAFHLCHITSKGSQESEQNKYKYRQRLPSFPNKCQMFVKEREGEGVLLTVNDFILCPFLNLKAITIQIHIANKASCHWRTAVKLVVTGMWCMCQGRVEELQADTFHVVNFVFIITKRIIYHCKFSSVEKCILFLILFWVDGCPPCNLITSVGLTFQCFLECDLLLYLPFGILSFYLLITTVQ